MTDNSPFIISFPDNSTFTSTPQPTGNAAYVSPEPDKLTEFSLATKNGTLGFLAHNYLAGKEFSKLRQGDVVSVVTPQNTAQKFVVADVQEYQATKPQSEYSDFIDTKDNRRYRGADVFKEVYGNQDGRGKLVLQTCIDKDGNDSWGRLFVIAYPYMPDPYEHQHGGGNGADK